MSNEGDLPLIQYWHSAQLPEEIAELCASFSRHNPGLDHVLYDEAGAEALLSERFSSRELEAFRACALPTSQADYLRYCAGFALGGLCIDADVRCGGNLRQLIGKSDRGILIGRREPLPDWIEEIFAWPYQIGPYRTVVNGAFATKHAGDPLLGLAVEIATANIEQRAGGGVAGVWQMTGPGVFTSLYLLARLGSVDAFIDYARGTVLEATAPLCCEIVGDSSRAEKALAGFDILAIEDVDSRLLEHVALPRPTDAVPHWSRYEDSLFK